MNSSRVWCSPCCRLAHIRIMVRPRKSLCIRLHAESGTERGAPKTPTPDKSHTSPSEGATGTPEQGATASPASAPESGQYAPDTTKTGGSTNKPGSGLQNKDVSPLQTQAHRHTHAGQGCQPAPTCTNLAHVEVRMSSDGTSEVRERTPSQCIFSSRPCAHVCVCV